MKQITRLSRDRSLNLPAVIDVTNFHKGTRHGPITRLTRADKSTKTLRSQFRAQLRASRTCSTASRPVPIALASKKHYQNHCLSGNIIRIVEVGRRNGRCERRLEICAI